MKESEQNIKLTQVAEDCTPYMRSFSSQAEAEEYNMIEALSMTDMQKFQMFCRMMRIGKMLASAKIVK